MPDRHSDFIHRENIAHFEAQLAVEVDPSRRALLAKLLEQERALLLPHPTPPRHHPTPPKGGKEA